MDVKILIAIGILLCGNASASNEVHDILQRIEELEERDRSQQAELDILKKQNMAMEDEVKQLKERDIHQTRRIEVLEEREQALQETIDVLRNDVEQTGEEPWTQPSDDETIVSQQDDKEARKTSDGHSRIRQLDQEVPVAFFATRTSHAEHLGPNQAVVFDNAITNAGMGYHASTGVFTAPVSGIYVFSSTILARLERAEFHFEVNGKSMARMYAYETEAYETLSMTAIFDLTQGDDVSLRCGSIDKLVHGDHYSAFSGFLLTVNTNVVNPQAIVG